MLCFKLEVRSFNYFGVIGVLRPPGTDAECDENIISAITHFSINQAGLLH